MQDNWFMAVSRRVRERWTQLMATTPAQRSAVVTQRLEELERAVARLAREQAKVVVGLEELNQTQEQFGGEFGPALRRLEEALHRRHQFDAALMDEGRRQGRDTTRDEAVRGMISLLDGLHQAIGAIQGTGADQAWLAGLEAVRRRGEDALAGWDIAPTSAPGMAFDPDVHEAVGVVAGDGSADPIIAAEVLRGYRQGERILRTARVVVSCGGQDDRDRSGDDELGGGSDRAGWQAPDS